MNELKFERTKRNYSQTIRKKTVKMEDRIYQEK